MASCLVLLDGRELPAREQVGGKAWSLARMRSLGLTCPPAFVLPTGVCLEYHERGNEMPAGVEEALQAGIAHLEDETGRTFGGVERPLLVSVRSGAPISMPGMMDTVLNLGLNDDVERALAAEAASDEYAADTHRRFVAGFADIVLRADLEEEALPARRLRSLVWEQVGRVVPEDPWEQLRDAVTAVLRSWNSPRAKAYRRHTGIPDHLGTAVTVQAMVFGNLGAESGTGVLFSRDPLTGAPEPYGEYLPGGQGEDVVSGQHTPLPLTELARRHPAVHAELLAAARQLEAAAADVQDIEFTVERGQLYLLQTRAAKRSPEAAVRLAVDLVDEGLITPAEAVRRVTPEQVRQVLRPRPAAEDVNRATVLASGEPASPGVGVGVAVTDADEAVQRAAAGEAIVFVARTTSPEDVHAMIAATAVCTETGGSTSHAAVVCRGLGRPAIVGCGVGLVEGLAGREVTVDGGSGKVLDGLLPLRHLDSATDTRMCKLAQWAAAEARLEVVSGNGDLVDRDGVLDLDELGIVEPAQIEDVVAGATTVRGSVLETDEGVATAMRAGVRRILADQPLPLLLAAAVARQVQPSGVGV